MDLNRTPITNAGLAHLSDLTQLETLRLSATRINDGALETLRPLKLLRHLDLTRTTLTVAGVRKLADALPMCQIESDHGTFGAQTPIADAAGAPDVDQRAAELVKSLGGKVRQDFSIETKPLLEINLLRSKVSDDDLEHFAKLKQLEVLILGDTRITNEGLAHLNGLTNLRTLDLGTTDITDAGFVHLKGLTKLNRLELFRTTIGDEVLASLSGLSELAILGLEGTRVGDAGLAHLKGLTKLYALNLSGTKVTDVGLEHLRGTRLKELHVQGTAVTPGAKKRLLDAITSSPRPAPKTPIADAPGSPRFTNGLGMEFALVPKGKALLGGGVGNVGTEEVELKHDFYLGVYEVTQEEWQKVMSTNPSQFTPKGKQSKLIKDISADDLKRFPVEYVSWDEAHEFIARLNDKLKQPGWVYQLPTEKEWQYACRGRPGLPKEEYGFDYYFDRPTNTLLPDRANFNNNVGRPMKVGSYTPNKLGLFDMHGNVTEWCDDLLPKPEKGYNRLFRGGSWRHEASWCRAVFQIRSPNFARFDDVGLRLARVPAEAKEK